MRSLTVLLASTLLVAQAAGPAFAFPNSEETFSRRPELRVLVMGSVGEKLSGAVVELCRVAAEAEGEEVPCRFGASDQDGELHFSEVAPGNYRLTAQLDGFIPTSLGPMSINAEDPIAPDRVVVLLNAACYDC